MRPQTDTHTDRHTDILTYRKHRPRGPMLRKYYLMSKWTSLLKNHKSKSRKLKLRENIYPQNKFYMLHSMSHVSLKMLCPGKVGMLVDWGSFINKALLVKLGTIYNNPNISFFFSFLFKGALVTSVHRFLETDLDNKCTWQG